MRRSFATAILIFVCTSIAAADSPSIEWNDLIDARAQSFEDPYADLTENQVAELGIVVRTRALLEGAGLAVDELTQAEARLSSAEAALEQDGIDVDWLLGQRWVVADSLGGGIGQDNRYSLALCQQLLDVTVLVSETEIYRAMQTLFYEDRLVAEGGSAVGVAALQTGKLPGLIGPIATIITGRNLDMVRFHRIMAGGDIQLGDLTLEGSPYGA